MLAELLTTGVYSFLFLFLRVGTAMMVMPGFGENYIPWRVRLGVALGTTFALSPLLVASVPEGPPSQLMELFLLMGGEIAVGLLIGGIARLIMSVLHVAGTGQYQVMNRLQLPTTFNQLTGKIIEQLRVAWSFTASTKVTGSGNDARAKVVVPETIDDDAG